MTTLVGNINKIRCFHPSPAGNNLKYPVQPRSGSQADKLWNRNIDGVDPDPTFIPKGAAQCFVPLKPVKRNGALYPAEPVKYILSLIV